MSNSVLQYNNTMQELIVYKNNLLLNKHLVKVFYSILIFQWQHSLCMCSPNAAIYHNTVSMSRWSASKMASYMQVLEIMSHVAILHWKAVLWKRAKLLFPASNNAFNVSRFTEMWLFSPPFFSCSCSLCIKSSLSVVCGVLLSGNSKGATGTQALSLCRYISGKQLAALRFLCWQD